MHSGLLDWTHFVSRNRLSDHKGLWANSFLRQMGYALVGIFSNVFVFEFGRVHFLSGGIVSGLLFLILYSLVVRVVVVVGVIPFGNNVIRRMGYKRTVLVSCGFSALAFLAMAGASYFERAEGIWLAGGLFGLVIISYWVTYFVLFSDGASEKRVGREFGILEAISNLAQAGAPIVGALVAIQMGFSGLFLVGVVLMLVSGLPMFFMGKHKHTDEVSWREFVAWSKEKTYMRASVAMGGRMVHDMMYEVFWPVYVFLLIGGLANLGIFGSVSLLAAAGFTYLVARLFDKAAKKQYQVVGAVGGSLVWLLRVFVRTMPQILVLESIDKLFSTTARMFFFGYIFKRAKGAETYSFVVYWILWQSVWLIVVYLVLIMGLLMWGETVFLPLVAGAGAVGLLLSVLIEEHHK